MRMHNPPHPGEIIKRLCLEPLGVSVTEAAQALDISRKTLSAILNGRAGISPEMAVRLSMAFGTSAESWLVIIFIVHTIGILAKKSKRNPPVSTHRDGPSPLALTFQGMEIQPGQVHIARSGGRVQLSQD